MKVSVIVPLYNKAPWVRRSLESLAAQTFTDFEVIVVDDGSTDGGGEVVANFGDPRIRLVTQSNAGPGAARNRGIAEAKGELVAFLDADDEWLPTFLEKNVRALEQAGPSVAAVVCGYLEFPRNISRERMWRRRGVREGLFRAEPGTSAARLVHLLAYMNPWATMARTEVVQRYGGFYGRDRCLYGEDAFLWLKVLLNERVLFSLEPLVRFHTEASALSKNLKGARPVEPFVRYPEELESCCPRELRPLLRQVLTIRASKTACMLSYWGRWEEASEILSRFEESRAWHQPWALMAAVCTNPAGALAGRVWRRMVKPFAARTSAASVSVDAVKNLPATPQPRPAPAPRAARAKAHMPESPRPSPPLD